MLFKNITILDENLEVREHMFVGTDGARIAYIGKTEPKTDYGRAYDGSGKLLMSAFYNCHGHSPMALMRGYGENMVLQDWLTKRIFPFEAKLDSKAVYWATLLTMAESLRFGIVSTSDMYYFIDDMVAATIDSGAKANISRAIVSGGESDVWKLASMQEMKRTFEAYHQAEDGRIRMDVSIHAEYTSDVAEVEAVSAYGREAGARMHVHVSETKSEHEACKAKRGMTPVQYFAKYGAFDMPATAAHCVWIEGEDFDILRDKGVTVAGLMGTLNAVIKAIYGANSVTRFRPHHFPFTEPSCEVDIQCHKCGGKGCPTCKGEGWIEVLGAGMVHPKVLRNCGIDPDEYSGFAFGMGLERFAMGHFKISDLRLIFENDERFLQQF